MKRFQRPLVAATAVALLSTGLAAFTAAPASAAVLGNVTVSPLSGGTETLFGGSVTSNCPASTEDSYWSIDGGDLPADQAILAPGNSTGDGPQSFSGASIANIKSANAGSFAADGPYFIKFNCVNGADGSVSDTYQAQMNYTAASGNWTIVVPDRGTATTLAASPAGPYELGTTTDLTSDVTPTTGADNPVGSVEFFRGATSLGVDNTLSPTGVANLNGVSLPQGSNSLTAVYTPAAGFTGSTSAPVVVEVTPVAARPTTSVLSVSPDSGAAYQAVTLTCAVSAGAFNANGTANFLDGATQIGSAQVVNGAAASITSSNFGAGAHNFVCQFVGSAPYTNSTSNTVAASYVVTGAAPDEQTVTVDIPQGALTITTPYTPAAPLYLGVAVLDAADSTYSASATFEDISITDTRAGNLGWTASVLAGAFSNGTDTFGGDRAGLTGLFRTPVPGNAMNAGAIIFSNTAPAAPGLGTPTQFASYAAGQPTGTADITGTFGIDQVPTSVTPGLYTSTVVFTAA